MANFTREVMQKVCYEESDKIRSSMPHEFRRLKKAHKLMRKEFSSLDQATRQKLQTILDQNEVLEKVYQMKMKLQEICSPRLQKNKQSCLSALQEWCKHAEESGIASLEEFSLKLKRYSLG